jgi:hypothetical protein
MKKEREKPHFEPVCEDPLRLLELRGGEGEPGVLVAAEGLELEGEVAVMRRTRERGKGSVGQSSGGGKKRKTREKERPKTRKLSSNSPS